MPTSAPYAGLRVVEITTAVAGAYASMLLADLGADVVKIEPPNGDESRRWPPLSADGAGDGCYFLSVNRGKRSLPLDLKSPLGKEALSRLLKTADVLIVNFRPKSLEALGLSVESVRRNYPRVIYATITGYGLEGARANDPAMDLLIQAESGLMSITGSEEGEHAKVPIPVVDLAAAMFALTGILAALQQRGAGSQPSGCHVDVSLDESIRSYLLYHITAFAETGVPPVAMGTAHPSIVPYRAFETADGQLVLAVFTDQQFRRACEVLNRSDLADDARYARVEDRVRHRASLEYEIAGVMSRLSTSDLESRFRSADVPFTRVNRIEELYSSKGLASLESILSFPQAQSDRDIHVPASPIKIDGRRYASTQGPPKLGEGTAEVLGELNFSDEELNQLSGPVADE